MIVFRVVVAAVLTTLVAGCGSQEPERLAAPSASDARVSACRGYALSIGDKDKEVVGVLRTNIESGVGSEDVDLDQLNVIRAAAVGAGTQAGLGTSDYRLFRAVVQAVDTLATAPYIISGGNADGVPQTQLVTALGKAVDAVHERCY